MNNRVPININDIIPASKDVLNHQGIPEDAVIPDHITTLFENAVNVFKEKSKPVSIMKEVTVNEFDNIFEGPGRDNPHQTECHSPCSGRAAKVLRHRQTRLT